MTVTMCIATKSLQGFSFLYTRQFGELSFDIFLLFWQWGDWTKALYILGRWIYWAAGSLSLTVLIAAILPSLRHIL